MFVTFFIPEDTNGIVLSSGLRQLPSISIQTFHSLPKADGLNWYPKVEHGRGRELMTMRTTSRSDRYMSIRNKNSELQHYVAQ
jgi:hypothetical protein